MTEASGTKGLKEVIKSSLEKEKKKKEHLKILTHYLNLDIMWKELFQIWERVY